MKIIVIYHKADFDGIFCREVAKLYLPDAEYIGWDYGDPLPIVNPNDKIYMLDISVDGLMNHDYLTWIDHHKSAIEKYSKDISGYRIDGVAACRLAYQFFSNNQPTKEQFINREVSEPWAVRLAGEYDIWDKRDPDAELFQHGLRSEEVNFFKLLIEEDPEYLKKLLEKGKAIQYNKQKENESIIKAAGFTIEFEGLKFLTCNHARYNSFLFTAGLTPEHDACFGFCWRDNQWVISLYHAPGKEHIDLSLIAVKYGGGGHKGACGFRCKSLPFLT